MSTSKTPINKNHVKRKQSNWSVLKKETSMYAADGKLTEEALYFCKVTGVDPHEIENK